MSNTDEILREQLSAWMDGELPVEEARFLERRLAVDAGLRDYYERLQLASSCLRGQSWRPMPASLSHGIADALAPPSGHTKKSGLIRWAVAASAAVLAVFLLPGLLDKGKLPTGVGNGGTASVAPTIAVPANLVASPASADLVAMAVVPVSARTTDGRSTASAPVATTAMAQPLMPDTIVSHLESPLPLDSQSPTDFPLVETSLPKSWPRSPMATGNDPALEAYLVRHNQMMGAESLGGFMPYVDVVTTGKEQAGDAGDGADGR